HGAGSVCGSAMAPRDFSTIGYERAHNPRLQMSREQFVSFKASEHHYYSPWFPRMHKRNQEGVPPLDHLPTPQPMDADAFAEAMDAGMLVVDVRSPEAFGGAHIPNSYSLPLELLPAFAGWVLPYDRLLGLVVDCREQVDTAIRYLVRIGYDDIAAYMDGLAAWETTGREYGRVPAIHANEITRRMSEGESFTLLDVRSIGEWEQGHLPGATHIYVGELPDRLDEVPRDRPVTTFCGSGARAMVAASLLKQADFELVEDNLGSMAACQAVGCQLVTD
ncbi:MAG: rhodanese-like domain-containing protein, partial [Planctomycetota bacterium]